MKKRWRIPLWLVSVAAVLAVSVIGGGYIYVRSTVPNYDGGITATDIGREVEVRRDSYGMPHIFAANDNDACFALGYCTAQDRLFQMEMTRRAVRGRLAEIAGEDVIRIDRLFRTITAARPVDSILPHLPAEVVASLNAYAAGVNRYLTDPRGSLPFEFALLGFVPEPWTAADCLTVLQYMAWALNFSFDTELLRAAVAAKVGPGMTSEIFFDYPPDGPVTIPDDASSTGREALLQTMAEARQLLGAPFQGASNSWVVSGAKSATGSPLLANDMHLGLTVPSIWYEAHLQAPGLNVSGVVLPGAPMVIAGANDHVAWGFTNLMVDDADYYIEQTDSAHPNQYLYMGAWEDMTVRTDTIRVRGGKAVPLTLRLTRHGVVIDDIIDLSPPPARPISMRWTISDFDQEATAIYRLNRARSIDDVEEAAALFKCPGMNWLYADDAGNIGYWAAAGIPIRNGFDGSALLPGWDGRYEWSGYVPTQEQPHLRNPAQGWIASANNKPVGDQYPYYISHCYVPADRMIRIVELLTAKDKLSVAGFRAMQGDDYLVLARDIVPKVVSALGGSTLSPKEAEALDSLKRWDFHAPAAGVTPAIFHVMVQRVIEHLFKARLGDMLYHYLLAENVFTVQKALERLVARGESSWFDNPATDRVETGSDILAQSFREAVADLTIRLGENIRTWRWGRLHNLTFFHPIGRKIPLLQHVMNIGPFPVGGGSGSINAALYRFSDPYTVVAGASQRHIFDLANMNNSLRVIPTGVSGNFMSHHYGDQVDLWRKVAYRPFQLDRDDIVKESVHTMRFIPAADSAAVSGMDSIAAKR